MAAPEQPTSLLRAEARAAAVDRRAAGCGARGQRRTAVQRPVQSAQDWLPSGRGSLKVFSGESHARQAQFSRLAVGNGARGGSLRVGQARRGEANENLHQEGHERGADKV